LEQAISKRNAKFAVQGKLDSTGLINDVQKSLESIIAAGDDDEGR
jgi:hypothetical protein